LDWEGSNSRRLWKNSAKNLCLYILVHEYTELFLEKVYENLQRLEDLRKFANFVKKFFETKL